MIILGIDPSMDSSGMCKMTLDDSYEIIDIMFYAYNKTKKWCINTERVQIECFGTQYAKLPIYERIDKALAVFDGFIDDVDYASIEDFSYGSTKTNSTYQIGEFVGAIRRHLFSRGIKIDRYSPNSIKRFATGSHNASKFMMMLSFKQSYPQYFPPEIENDLKLDASPQTDLNDAFWICEILRNKLKMQAGIDVDSHIKESLTRHSTKKSKSLFDVIPEIKT